MLPSSAVWIWQVTKIVRSIKRNAAWVQVHVACFYIPRVVNLSPVNDLTIWVVWLYYSYYQFYEHISLQVFSKTAEESGFPSSRSGGNRITLWAEIVTRDWTSIVREARFSRGHVNAASFSRSAAAAAAEREPRRRSSWSVALREKFVRPGFPSRRHGALFHWGALTTVVSALTHLHQNPFGTIVTRCLVCRNTRVKRKEKRDEADDPKVYTRLSCWLSGLLVVYKHNTSLGVVLGTGKVLNSDSGLLKCLSGVCFTSLSKYVCVTVWTFSL